VAFLAGAAAIADAAAAAALQLGGRAAFGTLDTFAHAGSLKKSEKANHINKFGSIFSFIFPIVYFKLF
jgi:hypothetical protein